MKLRVLVCGGRNYNDITTLNAVLDKVNTDLGIAYIIEGGARGADRLAGSWAIRNEVGLEQYPANWNRYGKRAGYLRNVQMAEEGKPDMIITFPGGIGTQMMRDIGKKKHIPVYRHDEWMMTTKYSEDIGG